MRKTLVTMLLALLFSACQTATPQDTSMRYLALGDSYTVGYLVDDQDSFPQKLLRQLRSEDTALAPPTLLATSGWTSTDLLRALDRWPEEGDYDLVTLLIGVNDQFQNVSLEIYQRNFEEILDRAVSLAGGQADHVIVLSIPDWGAMPYAAPYDRAQIGEAIAQFNAINQQLSQAAGARYVNITAISQEAANRPDLSASDGLHPSGVMYAEWVDLLLPPAREILHGD